MKTSPHKITLLAKILMSTISQITSPDTFVTSDAILMFLKIISFSAVTITYY
jgi:hypothetical protein